MCQREKTIEYGQSIVSPSGDNKHYVQFANLSRGNASGEKSQRRNVESGYGLSNENEEGAKRQ